MRSKLVRSNSLQKNDVNNNAETNGSKQVLLVHTDASEDGGGQPFELCRFDSREITEAHSVCLERVVK